MQNPKSKQSSRSSRVSQRVQVLKIRSFEILRKHSRGKHREKVRWSYGIEHSGLHNYQSMTHHQGHIRYGVSRYISAHACGLCQ